MCFEVITCFSAAQYFDCFEIDDGSTTLAVDMRVDCDGPKYKDAAPVVYAGLLVFTAGIPAMYSGLTFLKRDILSKPEGAGCL